MAPFLVPRLTKEDLVSLLEEVLEFSRAPMKKIVEIGAGEQGVPEPLRRADGSRLDR